MKSKSFEIISSYPKYFGLKQLLQLLNNFKHISESTLRRKIRNNQISATKLNNIYYFDRDEIYKCVISNYKTKRMVTKLKCNKLLNFKRIVIKNEEFFRENLSDSSIEEKIRMLAIETFGEINFKSVFFFFIWNQYR